MLDQVPSTLTKEVLPAQKPSSGFGIIMVSSLVMFFAVASSAFVLYAQPTRSCARAIHTTRAPQPMVISEVKPAVRDTLEQAAAEREPEPTCGTAEYRSNHDGSTTVFFETCPPGSQVEGWHTTIFSAPPSVEIREIR